MATHHSRSSNHTKRPLPAHARPSKPAPLSKRSSSHGGVPKSGHKVSQSQEEDFEDEEVMATSFLQYCTTCEKQIIVPNNSVLYCSESCRKKDNNKQLSYPFDYSPPTTPSFYSANEDGHFHDIVAPRSPTVIQSKRSSYTSSEVSLDENATSSDETPRKDSEASRYLRQYQTATSTETAVRPVRPRYNRASTSQATLSNAPSLSHTPASSFSFSLPYTPSSTRPLPPRTNPHSSSFGAKSIDLVIPSSVATSPTTTYPQYSLKSAPVLTTTSIGPIEGEILYEKSPIPSLSPANGSLRQLFSATPRW